MLDRDLSGYLRRLPCGDTVLGVYAASHLVLTFPPSDMVQAFLVLRTMALWGYDRKVKMFLIVGFLEKIVSI